MLFTTIIITMLLPSYCLAGEVEQDSLPWYYWHKDASLEIVHLRTPNTKVFLNRDGHRTYRVYLQAVHYRDKTDHLRDIKPSCTPGGRSNDMDLCGYADDLFGDVVTNDHIWTHEAGAWRGFAKFNTSGIPDGTTIDSVKLSLYALDCWGVLLGGPHDIRSMESNPQYGSGYSIYADAGNGDLYVDNFDPDINTLYTWILGDDSLDAACIQMTNQLPDDWFAIGMCDYYGGGWYSNAMGYDRGVGYVEIEEPPTAVHLVSFTASPDMDQVTLRWRTECEYENLEWLIERKTDDGDYEIIATMPGQMTTPGPTDYLCTDRDIAPREEYYYRLVNVNTQGERTLHSPLAVTIPAKGARLSVAPSLFSQKLAINLTGVYHKSGMLSIIDKSGRVMRKMRISGDTSPLGIEWDGTDNNGQRVNGGVYFIHLAINGDTPETAKVILIR